jgi:hypothetical protein
MTRSTASPFTRIAGANCGTISFQPTYSTATNHITQIGSTTPTYDANGSITADGTHTYTWDAAGRPVTIDGVSLTYDALGRMVEQNRSGSYTEIVYGPRKGLPGRRQVEPGRSVVNSRSGFRVCCYKP